ncbi:MAG: GDSL-type esterase/lipase family protein [Desulfotomaculaceae bacterium]|nr:GDSL-type esterase/lipase family protein [Desulfotomaculaceae bacterium]MDD4766291.1 GDSL-type esterase/lipase family protein [Desulfotomaculaceae bacterium]
MIKSIKGDITELDFDAIVNAANSRLSMGAGMLKARHIIHAAAMGQDLITDAAKVRSATRNALLRAEEMRLKSIAFPALGTGVGGLDYDLAAKVMVCEARRHVARGTVLEQIAFVLFEEYIYSSFLRMTGRKAIVCLGDSITYGFPFGPEASWVELSAKALGLNMINMGANGDTTRAMRRRFKRDVTGLDPAYVIIMGGGNDAFMGYPLEKFEENVETMVAEAQDNGICPVIGLPAPVYLGSFVTDEVGIAGCELDSYREWAEEFAADEELPVLDFFRPLLDPETGTAVSAYYCDDVHPSIKGYQVLAKASEQLLANIKNGL